MGLSLVLVMLFLSIGITAAGEPAPQAVTGAASEGLERFLNAIPEDNLVEFGFADRQELEHTMLGTPYRIYTIMPDDILGFEEGDMLSTVLEPTEMWLVPVLCGGTTRTLLTVATVGGAWKAVDLGGSGTAAELAQATAAFSEAEDYDLGILRIYQAGCEFVIASREGALHLVPLRSAAYVMGLISQGEAHEYAEVSPSEVFPSLAREVEKNIRVFEER
jgi:hypothetical protein